MRVPYSDAQDIAQPKQAVTGEQFVAPENLLMAAAHMDGLGRLFSGSGGGRFGSLKGKGSRSKPSTSLKVVK